MKTYLLHPLRSLLSGFSTSHSHRFAQFAGTLRSPSFDLRPLISGFPLPLSALFLLSSCASSQPRTVADRYTAETSSRVVSSGPAAMDDVEARRLASGGQVTSTPVKKKTVTSGGRVTKSSEETTTTTTETVTGSQAVAAPDAEVSPR